MERYSRISIVVFAAVIIGFLGLRSVLEQEDGRRHVIIDDGDVRESRFRAARPNVWAELSKKEAESVYDFVFEEWKDQNLTRRPGSAFESYVLSVEALRPNKTDVLSFLHGDDLQPHRWAKVVLSRYAEGQASLVHYAVGPLPVSGQTRVVPLMYPFNSGRNSVVNLMVDFIGSVAFGMALSESVSDITMELLDAKLNKNQWDDPNSLVSFGRLEVVPGEGLQSWAQFFRPGVGSSGRTLLPQGLYFKVNATGPASDWTVSNWYYNGILYKDVDHLREAIKSPSFRKAPTNRDGPWTDTENFDAHPAGREKPPPVSVQPYGPRYRLDAKERFVSWFGFEFYFSSTQATGVSLYDIRFKGERVMYELSMQEALAHYGGDDPMAGGQNFLDTFFGMGTSSFELLPGYDCPAYADYLSTDVHRNGITETIANNICIFEYTSDALLSRHTAQFSITASRNTYLTLRFVSTVGNYDYTFDYLFYLDGTIEVKVRASGYIFGAYHPDYPGREENEYGHRIHEALASSMHDHVISFKADMDVAGTANDLVRLAVEPTMKQYPWDAGRPRNTMHLREYSVDKETGLDWPRNGGELFIVYSADATNSWGQRKGYRVMSGTGVGNTPHLTVLNSTALGSSAKWSERDVWVVRHKDSEPRGADPLNYLDPSTPLVDFAKIADGESLDRDDYNGDLVLYVNLGSHHVPHSGDVPNTLMHTASSSVMFVPHNFVDRDPSRESVQGVRLQLRGSKSGGFPGIDPEPDEEDLKARADEKPYRVHKGVNYFGARYTEAVNLPVEALEPDIIKDFKTPEIRVSHLNYNGTAAGMWMA